MVVDMKVCFPFVIFSSWYISPALLWLERETHAWQPLTPTDVQFKSFVPIVSLSYWRCVWLKTGWHTDTHLAQTLSGWRLGKVESFQRPLFSCYTPTGLQVFCPVSREPRMGWILRGFVVCLARSIMFDIITQISVILNVNIFLEKKTSLMWHDMYSKSKKTHGSSCVTGVSHDTCSVCPPYTLHHTHTSIQYVVTYERTLVVFI